MGDTTTTMMWIDGVSPLDVVHAYAAAVPALIVCGIIAAKQQQAYSPILKHAQGHTHIDWARVGIVALILVAAIVANAITNIKFPEILDRFPFIGTAVWLALLVSVPLRRPDWKVLPEPFKGTIFLLSLVTCASMMPVEKLPPASWQSSMGLGCVSAVYDNILLTALALKQGGYDWGLIAYAVGFGGSTIWFGSSAGVALSTMYPEAKSAVQYLKHGWHVTLAYVAGFFVMYFVLGWQPHPPHETRTEGLVSPPTVQVAADSSGTEIRGRSG